MRPTALLASVALASLALLASGCAEGGHGGGSGGRVFAPSVAGPGEVLVDAQIVDAAGRPLPALACRLEPLAPSALHVALLGLAPREAATDPNGRVGFLLPLADVQGAYGGRFFRLTVLDANAEAVVRAEMFVDAGGARLGVVRLWAPADVQVSAPTPGAVEVAWDDRGLLGEGSVSGFKPALVTAAGDRVAEALVSGFAGAYRFTGLAAPPSPLAPAAAEVTAHLTRYLPGGAAFLAVRSPRLPVPGAESAAAGGVAAGQQTAP